MGYFMNRKKPMPEQTLRLAYHKMNAEGREILDQMVGQLEEVHSANTELFLNSDMDRKRPKKQD